MTFTVKLADKLIRITGLSPELPDFFANYLVGADSPLNGKPADIRISCTKEEILAERNSLSEADFSMSYLESLAVLRKIAEIFPAHGRLLIHGAAIAFDGNGYLFAAPSGTGKSTHIRLWREYLGENVKIINGDKPFVSVGNGRPLVYGTPWAGKENWQRNCSEPLSAICFLERGTRNTVRRLEPSEGLSPIFRQVYLPEDTASLGKTMELANLLLTEVPLYRLSCDMSEEAVTVGFEALTGLKYQKYKEMRQ